MKTLIITTWCATICLAAGQATILPDRDREALLEQLRAIREASDSQIEARFRVAIAAYRSAMGSDEAAFNLYMNCVEKVDFTDQNRRAQDFRDWRRNNDDRLKDPAFRRALRHQLRWLVLSLQATSEQADRRQLATGAQEIIDSIVTDASNLNGHQNILNQAVTGSVFARAYEIGNLEVEDWVMAPGRIEAVYDRIVLPEYRMTRRADALRSAWTKRIQQQARLSEEWSASDNDRRGRIGMASAQRSVEHEKFLAEQVPHLQWQMEVDVFKHGDPAGAGPRMLAHIGRHATHQRVRDWVSEFEGLLTVREVQREAAIPESWENHHRDPATEPERPPAQATPAEPPAAPAQSEDPDSIFFE